MTEPRFLIDTNILIYLAESLSEGLVARVEQCSLGELATSSIAFAEFARGIDWSQAGADDTVARLFGAIEILPFDRTAAEAYSRVPFKRGRFDRLIAAHALAAGLTIVTSNIADFVDVPGLRVEDWTQ